MTALLRHLFVNPPMILRALTLLTERHGFNPQHEADVLKRVSIFPIIITSFVVALVILGAFVCHQYLLTLYMAQSAPPPHRAIGALAMGSLLCITFLSEVVNLLFMCKALTAKAEGHLSNLARRRVFTEWMSVDYTTPRWLAAMCMCVMLASIRDGGEGALAPMGLLLWPVMSLVAASTVIYGYIVVSLISSCLDIGSRKG